MSTLQEKIAIMQAHADGKVIECQNRTDTLKEWYQAGEPKWNWSLFEYRVAKGKYVARVPLSICQTYLIYPPTPDTHVVLVSWEE